MVPPSGFEPLISTLKGSCPRPLDDGGVGANGSVAGRAGWLRGRVFGGDRARQDRRRGFIGKPERRATRPATGGRDPAAPEDGLSR